MYGSYVQVLEYLNAFAGDANRVDMAAGVRPTEEPLGPGRFAELEDGVGGRRYAFLTRLGKANEEATS